MNEYNKETDFTIIKNAVFNALDFGANAVTYAKQAMLDSEISIQAKMLESEVFRACIEYDNEAKRISVDCMK